MTWLSIWMLTNAFCLLDLTLCQLAFLICVIHSAYYLIVLNMNFEVTNRILHILMPINLIVDVLVKNSNDTLYKIVSECHADIKNVLFSTFIINIM